MSNSSAYDKFSETYLFLRGLDEMSEKQHWEVCIHRNFPKYAYREEISKTTV